MFEAMVERIKAEAEKQKAELLAVAEEYDPVLVEDVVNTLCNIPQSEMKNMARYLCDDLEDEVEEAVENWIDDELHFRGYTI